MVEVTWAFRKMCSVKSNEQLPKNSHSLLRMLVVYCDLGTVWLKYPDSKTNVCIYLCIKFCGHFVAESARSLTACNFFLD